jgi:large subunit ribosomal protein L18
MSHERALLRQRQRRRFRVRKAIRGTSEKPRLSVFRTHKHIYVQLIDDTTGRTLASASSLDKQLRDGLGFGGNRQAAGVKKVCFDRGAFRYHGRVAALADAARAAGLEF